MKRYAPFVIISWVCVIAVASGGLFFRMKKQKQIEDAKIAIGAPSATAAASQPGAQPPHVRGSNDAPVTLEEFGDFECQPCGELSAVLEKIEQDNGARLRVIFRQFPLAMHKHAFEAGCAAEAAGLQGRFWEMHDLLYHNRFLWPREPDVRAVLSDYAKTIGLDVERFKKDLDGEQAKARIMADRQRAASLAVDRTPVLFINDSRLPATSMNPSAIQAAIDAAREGKAEPPRGSQ
jgi:protein-disulfide isomerase